MTKIKSNNFIVVIPEQYRVKKHNPYLLNKLFFLLFPFRLVWPALATFIKTHPPDLSPIKGFRVYEILIGQHQLSFYSRTDEAKPEDMAEFLMNEKTGECPKLEEFNVGDIKGKTYGHYSKEFSSQLWWLKKCNCMICFGLQGLGMPDAQTEKDVQQIVKSIQYIPS